MTDLETLRSTYPRVSDIIGKQTERQMKMIPIDNLINASIRGTKVHSYCEAHLKGLWIPQIEEEYKSYVETFMAWADENIEKTLYNNIRLYDDKEKFSGEFDAIVVLKNSKKTALIDIKTSANPSISWPVQLAAYKHLCNLNGYTFETVFNIHLKRTKDKVKVIEIEHEDLTKYWGIFSSSLSCFNYFERKVDNDN